MCRAVLHANPGLAAHRSPASAASSTTSLPASVPWPLSPEHDTSAEPIVDTRDASPVHNAPHSAPLPPAIAIRKPPNELYTGFAKWPCDIAHNPSYDRHLIFNTLLVPLSERHSLAIFFTGTSLNIYHILLDTNILTRVKGRSSPVAFFVCDCRRNRTLHPGSRFLI
jgi:hypothetical protein